MGRFTGLLGIIVILAVVTDLVLVLARRLLTPWQRGRVRAKVVAA